MDKNNDKIHQKEPFEDANQHQTCSLTSCADDDDQNRLECRKCHRLVHYECTQLPLYQLQIYVNTYNEQYQCHNCVRITKTLRSKIGENSYHMMQKEIEKKDGVIKKLKNELAKNCSLKNDIESIFTKKIADLEIKTKKMIKEEIQQTKNFMKETSQKTYAEITKKHRENVKSAVTEQKEEDMNEQKDIESRKNNIILYGIEEPMGETKEKEQEQDKREIKEILYVIGVRDIIPKHHRIGQKDESGLKQRPIKMTLKNASEKEPKS